MKLQEEARALAATSLNHLSAAAQNPSPPMA
jgi:hypothetical protein